MIRTIVHFVFLALVGAATLVMSGPADSAERAPAAVVAAIERALSVPGARLDDVQAEGSPARGCIPREVSVPHAVDRSARLAVKVIGNPTGRSPPDALAL